MNQNTLNTQFDLCDKYCTEIELKTKVVEVETYILSLPQTEMEVQHQFFPGKYVRTLFIPAGTVLIGKTHRKGSINIVKCGSIAIRNLDGWMSFSIGDTFYSEAGIKKLGVALVDTVYTNIFDTDLTNFDGLEEELTVEEENTKRCPFDFITGSIVKEPIEYNKQAKIS